MVIECANARIKTKQDFNAFMNCIKDKESKEFIESMRQVDGQKDYLKTDFELSMLGRNTFFFCKEEKINIKDIYIKHNIKQIDINILFY